MVYHSTFCLFTLVTFLVNLIVHICSAGILSNSSNLYYSTDRQMQLSTLQQKCTLDSNNATSKSNFLSTTHFHRRRSHPESITTPLLPAAQIEISTDPSVLIQETRQHPWVSKIFADHILDYDLTTETNSLCTEHFQIYRQHLRNFTAWAVQMFDSSDLLPRGFTVADSYNFGNFDECVNTQIPRQVGISPKYCLATFKFSRLDFKGSPKSTNHWERPVWDQIQITEDILKARKDFFNLAFCIPNSCSSKDLENSLETLLEGPMREGSYNLSVSVNDLQCTTNEDIPESTGTTVLKNLIISITCVIVFCSAIDLFLAVLDPEKHKVENLPFTEASGLDKWLLLFSFPRSYFQIIKVPSSLNDYHILHGFKCLFMIVILVGHRVLVTTNGSAIVNWTYFEKRIDKFSVFFVGMVLTDIFFCINGFLSTLSLVKQFERNTFNIWVHVTDKLIRTLPPYIFVLACTIYILPTLGNGPLWKTLIESEVGYCRENWWTNVLFINNYYKPYDFCLIPSWFIAAHLHFFVVGSFITYLCCRWRSRRVLILGTALVLSALFPFFEVYRNQYVGFLRMFYPDFMADARHGQISHLECTNVVKKSHTRSGGFIVGVIAAFVFNHLKESGYKFTKIQSWAGAFFGIALSFSVAGYGYVFYLPTREYNVIENALYAALHTQLISAGFIIIAIIQITSGLGILDTVFRVHELYFAASKLSLWLSLINVPVFLYIAGSQKTAQYVTFEQMIYGGQYWGDIFLLYILALYCHIIIEVPINHIRPVILKYIRQRTSAPSNSKVKEN